jgi:Ni/Co efflux regulator RcnB
MKSLISIITLSLSAVLATSAMAAPDHRSHDGRYAPAPHWSHDAKDRHYDQKRFAPQHVNPSREWRSGQRFPEFFNHSRFQVSHSQAKRLPKAGRHEQWFKINGDYVLVNERNDRIIRILS